MHDGRHAGYVHCAGAPEARPRAGDFGSTAVTGVHVTCVADLRAHYGLENRPVKVVEPYQMLGGIDEDLKRAMGIDVEGVLARNTLFGLSLRCAVVGVAVWSASATHAETSEALRNLFADPPRGYSTGPLCVWNDDLTEKQIVEALRDMAGQRVKQVWVHPRPGLMTP